MTRRIPRQGIATAAIGLAVVFSGSASGVVSAQSTGGGAGASVVPDPVDPDFKGAVGLGLIGAELGFVIPAVAGMRDAWAYIVFPIVGAGGGAVGGYFGIEQGTGSAELAVATLVTGMALIIPAMVVTLSATAYDPDEDLRTAARAAPPALVQIEESALRLGAPAVSFEVVTTAPAPPVAASSPGRSVRVSLVSGRF